MAARGAELQRDFAPVGERIFTRQSGRTATFPFAWTPPTSLPIGHRGPCRPRWLRGAAPSRSRGLATRWRIPVRRRRAAAGR